MALKMALIQILLQIDVWSEMAKEMKQNFGPHRSKSAGKAGSGADSVGNNSSSWGMSAIPPIPNGGNPPSHHDLATPNTNPLTSPVPNDSNHSSIQSNSNSEYSDIDPPPPAPPAAQLAVRQRSSTATTPKRNYATIIQHPATFINEDPYGPMSSHFYTGSRHHQTVSIAH